MTGHVVCASQVQLAVRSILQQLALARSCAALADPHHPKAVLLSSEAERLMSFIAQTCMRSCALLRALHMGA